MTPPIEKVSAWLVDWSLVTIIDNMLPPRDPNDDDDEDDEDDDERHTRTMRTTTRTTSRR